MLYAYIFILCLLGYETRGAAVKNPDDVVFFSTRLANLLKRKCSKTAGEIKTDTALEGIQHFSQCWMVERPDPKLDAEEFYESCIENAGNFTSHLSTFVDTLKPCLEPQENYLTEFILNSYGNFNHYFCTFLGAAVRSYSTSKTTIHECAKEFELHPETDPLISCYNDSKILGDNSTVDVITKTELCSDITQIHLCYEELFDRHCPESSEFRNMRVVLLRQALENCSDDNDILRKI